MANGKQLRMLEAMWGDVSRMPTFKLKAIALKKFLANRFNVGGLPWVESNQVSKIARAITAMKTQGFTKETMQ